MLHTYLEWITEVPWRLPNDIPIDLNVARQILEDDHFGLDRVKQRIIEFLAVQKQSLKEGHPFYVLSGRQV
ncbi:ATP-dependent Lon protease [Nitrosomonas cryotolerans]|uniref:hypothetical protein n=1 Tax=Nitrosomonas cryotolerans TaxID=44575 RepID=UPI000490EC8F|nr:hypothetical protein [Nitrosomonas cryotolerans]SFP89858.1 ATP-dependent Lon protease [Nitrosomonas cryotolerans]